MRKEDHKIKEAPMNMLGKTKYHHEGDCQAPQFASEMHYPGEHRMNMNKGSMEMPGQQERAHHGTFHKDRLIEETMRTERNDYAGSSVDVVYAKGIIGNSTHSMNFKFPEGENPKKRVSRQPSKDYPSGEHKAPGTHYRGA
jgi:hypothetical protein